MSRYVGAHRGTLPMENDPTHRLGPAMLIYTVCIVFARLTVSR